MDCRQVPAGSLRTRDSRYRLPALIRPASDDRELEVLARSLGDLGTCAPLIVHERDGALHIVDGFKRVVAAHRAGLDALPCSVLPVATPPGAIVRLIALLHRSSICASPATRAVFTVDVALALGVEESEIVTSILPLLGLEPHAGLLARLATVARLPPAVLRFAADRRYSLRRCERLAARPRAVLAAIFDRQDDLALTASIADELLENLGDHLRATGRDAGDLLAEPEIRTLWDSPLTPEQRTGRLREILRRRRYPTLTVHNERLRRISERLRPPPTVRIGWDPTLERKEVTISLRVTTAGQWEQAAGFLAASETGTGITELLAGL